MSDPSYSLPKGWKWAELGEVCKVNPRRPRLNRDAEAPTSFVPMSAVEQRTGTVASYESRPFREVRSGYTYIEDNDVIWAKITPCMQNRKSAIAKGMTGGFGFASTEFHVICCPPEVVPEFILAFLRQSSFLEEAQRNFRGAVGQQRVPATFLKNFRIPLPPPEDQRRIVARIEELMARIAEARALRAAAIKDAASLLPAALSQAFPPATARLPSGWQRVKLGDTIQLTNGKFMPKRRMDPAGAFPVYGANGVVGHANRKLIDSDTIVIGRVGACGAVTLAKAPCWVSDNAMYVSEISNGLEIGYLAALLESLNLGQLAKVGAQPSISQGQIEDLKVPLPPPREQSRIVARLAALQAHSAQVRDVQHATDDKLDRLAQSILSKAFRGEL